MSNKKLLITFLVVSILVGSIGSIAYGAYAKSQNKIIDLRVKSLRKASFHPYGFYLYVCVSGNTSINDLKPKIKGLKSFPFSYAVLDENNRWHYRDQNAVGSIENFKYGRCTVIGFIIQRAERKYFDQTGIIRVILDRYNLVKETNEYNNQFLLNTKPKRIEVINPKPNITLTKGTFYPIQWEAKNVRYVNIATYGCGTDKRGRKGCSLIEILARKIPANRGIYNWYVAEGKYEKYYRLNDSFKILVYAYEGGAYDFSDGYFKINTSKQGYLIVWPVRMQSKAISAGTKQVPLFKVKFISSWSDIKIDKIIFKVRGKIRDEDLKNIKLYDNDKVIGTKWNLRNSKIEIPVNLVIPKNTGKEITLKADISENAINGEIFLLEITDKKSIVTTGNIIGNFPILGYPFSIIGKKNFELISPKGGEHYKGWSKMEIMWKQKGLEKSGKIEIYVMGYDKNGNIISPKYRRTEINGYLLGNNINPVIGRITWYFPAERAWTIMFKKKPFKYKIKIVYRNKGLIFEEDETDDFIWFSES